MLSVSTTWSIKRLVRQTDFGAVDCAEYQISKIEIGL